MGRHPIAALRQAVQADPIDITLCRRLALRAITPVTNAEIAAQLVDDFGMALDVYAFAAEEGAEAWERAYHLETVTSAIAAMEREATRGISK